MNFSVFDLHCDTAMMLAGTEKEPGKSLRSNDCHFDLTRAAGIGGYAQCFACFTTTAYEGIDPVRVFEKSLEATLREVERNSDLIRLAYCAEDVEANRSQGLMSAILTIEGPAGFGFDPALLEDLYNVGFRITSLGWNEKNPLTGSHVTGGGLTDLGREYVAQAQRLGMLIDVSHISDEGFWDIMDITKGPVIATHSNSRSVCGVSRNLTDDMFLAICKTGGVAGFNQCAPFVGTAPDLDTACDHIVHLLSLDPDGTHVALGGDLDGCGEMPAGFDGVQDYPKFAHKLLSRGLSEDTVKNVFWNNAMEVFRHAVRVHQK